MGSKRQKAVNWVSVVQGCSPDVPGRVESPEAKHDFVLEADVKNADTGACRAACEFGNSVQVAVESLLEERCSC